MGVDDGDEVVVFVDGFAVYAGAGGDGRDVDGRVGLAQVFDGLFDVAALALGNAVAVLGQGLAGIV